MCTALDAAEGGGVLALGERAAGAGDVVAHRAVDAEELGAAATSPSPSRYSSSGMAGPGAERLHVGGERRDLLVGELHGLLLGLRPGARQRHAAGADLEVDGSRADADEARRRASCPAGRGRGRWRSWPGRASRLLRRQLVGGGAASRRSRSSVKSGVDAAGDRAGRCR